MESKRNSHKEYHTSSIPVRSKYPQAAPMMQPTNRPIMTAHDFMMGAPKRSQKIIVTNTEKPRPINSALPQGKGCGALVVGHRAYWPDEGRDMQSVEPPAHCSKPCWSSETPMSMTVGPVTTGGKIFLMIFGGMKERTTSIKEVTAAVPKKAPYASGQGSFSPLGDVGQNPFEYICSVALEEMEMVEKDTPTKESRPVPIK